MAVATKKAAPAPKTNSIKAKTINMDADKVKDGDIVAVLYWAKVKGKIGNKVVHLQDLYDPTNKFAIEGKDLIETCMSADQFNEEVETTQTDLALKLQVRNTPFTCGFFKKPEKGEVQGEYRVIRGKWLSLDDQMGRSNVEDLDIDDVYRLRQIDHRTIQWLIINNVKYTLKGADRKLWVVPKK